MTAPWLEFSIRPRWPERGYMVVDQHGHEHAQGQLADMIERIQILREQQAYQLQAEGAWNGRDALYMQCMNRPGAAR